MALVASVIAGLAVGVTFVVVFASLFGPAGPVFQKYSTTVLIIGLKDIYHTGEAVEFSVRVSGYVTFSGGCGFPSITILKMSNSTGSPIYSARHPVDYFCDEQPHYIEKDWTLNDLGFASGIELENGQYKVLARYGKTVEKQFEVISG